MEVAPGLAPRAGGHEPREPHELLVQLLRDHPRRALRLLDRPQRHRDVRAVGVVLRDRRSPARGSSSARARQTASVVPRAVANSHRTRGAPLPRTASATISPAARPNANTTSSRTRRYDATASRASVRTASTSGSWPDGEALGGLPVHGPHIDGQPRRKPHRTEAGAPVHEGHVQVEGAAVEGLNGELDPAHAELALRAVGRERQQPPAENGDHDEGHRGALRMVLTAHKLAAPALGLQLSAGMATRATSVQITMPQMGESVTEGTVLGWLKQVGDRVEADEPLVEISTDKVDAEVPAPVSGTLVNIAAEADETVQVGSVLGEIEPDGDGAAPAAPDGGARRRRRGRRRRVPGDGRLGGRGHRARVAREGRRRRCGRRPAGRDLHRQGRCRGALARGGHDRGDPGPGRRDSGRWVGAVPDRRRGGRHERPSPAECRADRDEARRWRAGNERRKRNTRGRANRQRSRPRRRGDHGLRAARARDQGRRAGCR